MRLTARRRPEPAGWSRGCSRLGEGVSHDPVPNAEISRRDRALSVPLVLGLALSAAAVIGSALWILRARPQPTTLRLATGAPDGVYHRLGHGLRDAVAGHASLALQLRETAGSRENIDLLERGEVDLAFVQDDTPGGDRTRSVAVLHREYLHVLVRARGAARPLTDVGDLAGRKLAIGASGSGTAAVARDLLRHFGVVADPGRAWLEVGAAEAVARLRDGSVDAAFVLSALPAQAVVDGLRGGAMQLFSLGEGDLHSGPAAGLAAADPRFEEAVIPARTYGDQPRRPVHTISVRSVLVASAELSDAMVREVTRVVFDNRIRLARSHPAALRLRERYEPAALRYPAHDGAVDYYLRGEPAFWVAYSEQIALVFSLLVGVFSGVAALRQLAARRRKERIDFYYKEVARLIASAEEAGVQATRAALLQLRSDAFQNLVDEKLAPDESFTIFQDLLRGELGALESGAGPRA